MGESSFVKQVPMRSQPQASQKEPVRQARPTRQTVATTDWILIGIVVGLTLFGLLMVYSASPKFAQDVGIADKDYFLKRQAMWAFVGLIVAFVLSRFNYHIYQRLTVLFLGVTLLALLVVAILGDTTLGANRSMFLGSVRPSELAKIVTILYIAVWLNSKRDVLNDISLGLLPLMVILGITGGLIMIQPDLSAAITVIILGAIMFFLAGGAWRQIGLTIAATLVIGWVVINIYPTGVKRITEYWAGLHNPLNASYHVQRSLEAIVNGRLFGVGIGLSRTKFTGLPVAPTDSIFAVVTEETGLLGAGLVIAAYLILMWRGLEIAKNAPDHLGSLLASGITVWIVIEAVLNMAVMVNLLPQAGNALPLISYGGSNLTVTLGAIGILLNVAREGGRSNSTKGGSNFGSVVDLRWRDRRRGVSRYGGPSGSR